MKDKRYTKEHAVALLRPLNRDEWRFSDEGLFPPTGDFYDSKGLLAEYKFHVWRPAAVFEGSEDAPDIANTPALPFPFDGRDLAAFMLDGLGYFVGEFYGGLGYGVDETALNEIDSTQNYARQAVRDAFAAFREATERVGQSNHELSRKVQEAEHLFENEWNTAKQRHGVCDAAQAKPDDSDDLCNLLRAEYEERVALAKKDVSGLKTEMERLGAESAAAQQKWLTAMVVCLLKPEPQAATEAPAVASSAIAQEQTSAEPVVVVSSSDAPAWTVSRPQRYNGYTAPLHRLLDAAHLDSKPCPTARDVVEAWRNNVPAEVAKVLPDGFDYYDAKGNTKSANLEAIRKAIVRMTRAR